MCLFFTCGQKPQLSQQALSAYAQSVSHRARSRRSAPTARSQSCFTPRPPSVGESRPSCLVLPRAAFQPSQAVPVRGDVRECAGRLQPSRGARPRLGGASGEGEAAAFVPEEHHGTPTEQGTKKEVRALVTYTPG